MAVLVAATAATHAVVAHGRVRQLKKVSSRRGEETRQTLTEFLTITTPDELFVVIVVSSCVTVVFIAAQLIYVYTEIRTREGTEDCVRVCMCM